MADQPAAARSAERTFDPTATSPGQPPSERVRVRRNTKKRGRYERELVEQVLDATAFCHLGYIQDGNPVVIPKYSSAPPGLFELTSGR